MNTQPKTTGRAWKGALLAAAAASLPAAAEAHRFWMLPSATVLSGEGAWLTADAAIANTLFYFDHHAMPLDDLVIYAPDGGKIAPQHVNSGEYRSTFDAPLDQQGTYNVEVFSDTVVASYTENGEEQNFRGSRAEFLESGLAERDDVEPGYSSQRTEFFVTVGAPTDLTVETSGRGLELEPMIHPNDLYAGETAQFRLLLDGEPVADQEVEVVKGGVRYRNAEDPMMLTTDSEGMFEVTWPEAGMYWVHSQSGQGGRFIQPGTSSAAYNGTFEVLPQ